MERAVASLKWKTTASAACIPRRDSTSPYSMAATVFPTASRIVCSLCSGVGGPIILGCSPLLACWLSIRAPSASCRRPLPSDTAHLPLAWLCPPSWERQARYKLEEVTRWLRQLARYDVPGMRPPRRVWSRPPPSPSQRSKLSSSSAFRSAINFSRRPLYSATDSLLIRSTSREVSSTGMPSASLAPVSSTAPFGRLRLASLGVIRSLLPSTRVSYPYSTGPRRMLDAILARLKRRWWERKGSWWRFLVALR